MFKEFKHIVNVFDIDTSMDAFYFLPATRRQAASLRPVSSLGGQARWAKQADPK
jgi:hypothetical protein